MDRRANRIQRRTILRLYFDEGKSAEETHKLICEKFGENFVPRSICNMWFNKFKAGEIINFTSAHATKSELKALLDENRSQSDQQLADQLRVSRSLVNQYSRKMELEKIDDKQVDTVKLVEKILDYFDRHLSVTKAQELICDEFGEDIGSLSYCEKWYNRFTLDDRNISKDRIKFEEFKALHEQNLLDNLTRDQCAHKLGVSISTLDSYFKKINQEDKNKQVDTVEFVGKIFDYFSDDKSVTEAQELICDEFGDDNVFRTYCAMWYKRFKLGDRDISKDRIKFEELEALHVKHKNLTINDWAQALNVSIPTIQNYLSKIKEDEENEQVKYYFSNTPAAISDTVGNEE